MGQYHAVGGENRDCAFQPLGQGIDQGEQLGAIRGVGQMGTGQVGGQPGLTALVLSQVGLGLAAQAGNQRENQRGRQYQADNRVYEEYAPGEGAVKLHPSRR